MRHPELAARLDASAERLTARVLAEMYADPFWLARFGVRADRHGRQDGRFHIDYLIQAVLADAPGLLACYARWLQPVLTSRGMCTRHLVENFARLADAIRDEAWPDGEVAIAMLDAARGALAYPAGSAREVQQAEPALATAAARAVAAAGPADGAAGPGLDLVHDLVELVDHAADAIALGNPDGFARHAVWLAGFLASRGVPLARLAAQLEAVAAVAPALVSGPAAGELAATITAALARLGALVGPGAGRSCR